MRHPDSTQRKIFGLILAIGVTVSLPSVIFGAARTSSSSGSLRSPMTRPQHSTISPRFDRPGFLGLGEVGEEQVIIIQQVQPAPTVESRKAATNNVYVPPCWVDGGYGVQVSVPGHWIDPKQEPKR